MKHTTKLNHLLLFCITGTLAWLLLGSLCWAGSISGRVTDISNGTGLQGIKVVLFPAESNIPITVTTGANGNYSASGFIPDGSYKVAFADPNKSFVTRWYDSATKNEATVLTITATSTHTRINAALTAGGIIEGLLTDIQTNAPISEYGAIISIYSGATNVLVDEVIARGSYQSSVLPPGSYKICYTMGMAVPTCYNQKPDLQNSTPVTVTAYNKTSGINAVFAFFGKITGKVTDATGAGINDVTVDIYDSGGNLVTFISTDATGNYTSEPLPNGNYTMKFSKFSCESVWYKGALDITGATPLLLTAPSNTVANVQLRRYVTISGKVTTTNGAPFFAKVELYDTAQKLIDSTFSSPQAGSYSFGNTMPLMEGNYKIRFSYMNAGYAAQWYQGKGDFANASTIPAFSASTIGINAVMKELGKISGQITNSKRYGIPNVTVTVFDTLQNIVANLATDSSGYYQTGDLTEGNYKIRFDGTSSGYPLKWYNDQPDFAHATPVSVALNGVTGVNATLIASLKISGKITNSSGNGIPNAWIYLYSSQNVYLSSCKSDLTGAYDTGELAAGKYRIKVLASGYPEQWNGGAADFAGAADITISLTNGAYITNLTLKEEGGRIYGRVIDSSGAGIDSAFVYFYDAANGALLHWVSTDAAGNYSSGKLADGGYRVLFQSPFTGHLAEWFDNKGNSATATTVAITAVTPATGINATLMKNMTLSVTLNGSGGGSLHSAPSGIACTSGTCTAKYPENSLVDLSATPDSISLFAGWGAACTNLSGNCKVTMTGDKQATATFALAPKARIGVNGYDSLAAAYAAAGIADTILALDAEMPDAGFALNLGKTITLKGGYQADYKGKSGLPSLLNGILTIATGSLTVENIVVK